MSKWTKEIASTLGCSEQDAKRLCTDTQDHFKGTTPSFQEISRAVSALKGAEITPIKLADHIRDSGGPTGAKQHRRRKGGGLGLRPNSSSYITFDENGELVSKSLLKRPRRSMSSSQSKSIGASIRPDKSFARLKKKFGAIDKRAESDKLHKLRERLEHQRDYWVACPQCGDRVRLDKVGKHYKSIHLLDMRASDFQDLVMAANKSKSDRTENNPPSHPGKDGNKAKFYDDVVEKHDGSKDIGYLRRERGRFGSFPIHEDHDDESDP